MGLLYLLTVSVGLIDVMKFTTIFLEVRLQTIYLSITTCIFVIFINKIIQTRNNISKP